MRDGDMETALTQKRLQALNHALVMESMKTRLAVDKAGRALKRAKNAKKKRGLMIITCLKQGHCLREWE